MTEAAKKEHTEHTIKIGHNMYTSLVGIEEAQRIKAGIKSPDLMDIDEQEEAATRPKRQKKWFTGRGPFSKINKLTTDIGMLDAIVNHGLGGDGFSDIRSSGIAQGISEYHKIATDPNYGKIK